MGVAVVPRLAQGLQRMQSGLAVLKVLLSHWWLDSDGHLQQQWSTEAAEVGFLSPLTAHCSPIEDKELCPLPKEEGCFLPKLRAAGGHIWGWRVCFLFFSTPCRR